MQTIDTAFPRAPKNMAHLPAVSSSEYRADRLASGSLPYAMS